MTKPGRIVGVAAYLPQNANSKALGQTTLWLASNSEKHQRGQEGSEPNGVALALSLLC